MSLEGAKIICINENGQSERIINPEGKTFRFGYYTNSNYILENAEAKGIHCEIYADAFNRITIVNYCKKNPITINGCPVKNQRPLFHNNKITIFNNEFIWQFTKAKKRNTINEAKAAGSAYINNDENVITPEKQQISEQPPESEPWGKRKKLQITRRLSVHSFAYCIGKDELNKNNILYNENSSINTIIDSSEFKENIKSNDNIYTDKCTPISEKKLITSSIRRRTFDCVTPIKSVKNDTTSMNINTSIYQEDSMTPRAKLELCKSSDVLVTSYSPNSLNKNQESLSFAVIKSNKNTPQSIYGTPKSVLSERSNEDSNDSTNLIYFSTPQNTTSYNYHSSMHLIDLTTPALKQKTPIKQNMPSPLLKSALKNSIHNSMKKSVQKLKTKFATVLEEPCSPVNISGGKKKYPVTPSTAKNISNVRKSLNMSINMKDKLINSPNKITPKNISIKKSDVNMEYNLINGAIPTTDLSTEPMDLCIETDDLSTLMDEDSIIEVSDDSIYSNKSTPIICNKSQKNENEKQMFKNTSQNTPKSLNINVLKASAKKLQNSPNVSPLSSKKLASVKKISSSNLSSSSILNTTPMRRSLSVQKVTPRTIEKTRLSYIPSSAGRNITPIKKSIVPTSTPLTRNIKLQKSVESKNHSSPFLSGKTPKINSCRNLTISNISTPIDSKNIYNNNNVAKKQINLYKKSPILKLHKISNIVEHRNINKSKDDLECGNESELNQTFTINATNEENQKQSVNDHEIHKNTENKNCNVDIFGTEKLLKPTERKENIHFNDLIGVRELLMTPKKDIVVNLVGIKELVNTPKNNDKNITVTGITELFQTPIKSSDDTTQLMQMNSNSKSKNKDQILKIQSPKNEINSVTPEKKSISTVTNIEPTETRKSTKMDITYGMKDTDDVKKQENKIVEQILSVEEKFDKLIGKPTITKQYSPSKNISPRSTCTILNDPETPKSDIQDWIDNLNESFTSKETEKYEPCSNVKVPEPETLKYDEEDIQGNGTIADLIMTTNESGINFLDDTKSIFSEELAMSDKSEDEEFTNFQSTPKIRNALSKTCAGTQIKPIRRSTRNLNKSIGCKQCLTPPNILETKKGLEIKTDIQDISIKTIAEKQKMKKNLKNTSNNNLSTHKLISLNENEEEAEKLEMQIAFENFSNQPKFSQQKAKTPDVEKVKIQNNRKTLGGTASTSFNLKAAKEEREMELAFENFNDQPNFSEEKAKTPDVRKAKIQNNRKTLGGNTSTSFNLKTAQEEREMELAFQNFNDQPNFSEQKAKTPDVEKVKIQNNRKTLGGNSSTSFNLKVAQEEREMELAFQNFNDQPNFSEQKAKTPDVEKIKIQNNRKTLGGTASTSFNLKAAKEEREMELAFQNFNDQPNFSEEKAKTPEVRKPKIQDNRKTVGGTTSTSFNLKTAQEEREMELAFQNFNDQPKFSEQKAKTPDVEKVKIQNNRKTLGGTASTSFNLKVAQEEREMELAFENFNDQPNFSEEKAKTPDVRKAKIQNNRKTLGGNTSTSFNLKAAQEEREMELAFENFNDQPKFSQQKAKTPDVEKVKIQTNRKTLGGTASTSLNLKAAKEEREMELAFENFNDQPNFCEEKAKTPDVRKAKIQNNRKTLGGNTSTSFNLKAAQEEREMELAFENFNDQPKFSEQKAKTPDVEKVKIQNNRKTLGGTASTSLNLKAAKEEREMELAFENFNDQPIFSEEKAKTPDVRKAKIQNNRKTLGGNTSTSFNLKAAQEEREMELAFQNFNDQPNFSEQKAKTPDVRKAKIQNNRKTLGGTASTSFNVKTAQEEREMELAFQNFNDQPNFSEQKAKTPDVRKAKIQNNRKTLGGNTSTFFNLKAAQEEREMELAFENFNDQPNFSEQKAKTPDVEKVKIHNNRKTLGGTTSTSFNLKAAKEEREMELAFENFNDQRNFSEEKAKTPDVRKVKTQHNRKTLGNHTLSGSFDLEVAKEEHKKLLEYENFKDKSPTVMQTIQESAQYSNNFANHSTTVEQVAVADISTCSSIQPKNTTESRSFLQHNSVEEEQVKEKGSEENKNMIENITAKRRARSRKLFNDVPEKDRITEQAFEFIESTPIKRRRRVKNLINNVVEGIEQTINFEEEKTNINTEIVKDLGRTGKNNKDIVEQMHEKKNTLEEEIKPIKKQISSITKQDQEINDASENIKTIESVQTKSRGRTGKQNITKEGKEINDTAENIKTIESVQAKSRGRTRKQNITKEEEINDTAENIKTIESVQAKSRGRTSKQNITKEEEEINDTAENIKPIESTPVKARGRTRKQITSTTKEDQEINDTAENIKPIESTPAKSRGRTGKQMTSIAKEDQEISDTTENIKPIESTPAKSRGRTRKQITSTTKEDQEISDTAENIKPIESVQAKSRGRTKKQNITKEEEINDTAENIKPIESTPAKSRGRTRKQITSTTKEDQEINDTAENIKPIESTPAKSRGRTRKQITSIAKEDQEINDTAENIKPIESTPAKSRGRTGKQITSIAKEDQEISDTTENIKLIESTPAKSRGRTRKQITSATKEDQEISDTAENIKPIESTPVKSRGRARKQNNSKEDQEINVTAENIIPIESTPAKSRGRTRKQITSTTKEDQEISDTAENIKPIESTPAKVPGRPKRQINSTIQEDKEIKNITKEDKTPIGSTPAKLRGRPKKKINDIVEEMQIKKDEETIIKNTPVKSRGRTKKQQQTIIDNIDVEDDKENLMNKNTPAKSKITKNVIEEFCTPLTPILRSRRNLKVVSYSEKSDSFTEIFTNSDVLNKGELNQHDVKSEEKTVKNKIKSRTNKTIKQTDEIIEPKTKVDILSTSKDDLLRANTPNSDTVVTGQNKRKVSDDNDNSTSEELMSAGSIRSDRRRRLQSESKTNNEEDDSKNIIPVKSTRGKRKVDEIPVESDISTKRITRKRK